MFRASVEVQDPDLLTAYTQVLEGAPEVANSLINATVNRERDGLLAQLHEEPGPVVYPFTWKSDKQRRAFFATNGFGRGIPTKRTHILVNAWRLVVVYEPNRITSIMIENNDPKRRFVTGQDQQPGHAITGWYQDDSLIADAQKRLTDAVETDLIKSFFAIEEV